MCVADELEALRPVADMDESLRVRGRSASSNGNGPWPAGCPKKEFTVSTATDILAYYGSKLRPAMSVA